MAQYTESVFRAINQAGNAQQIFRDLNDPVSDEIKERRVKELKDIFFRVDENTIRQLLAEKSWIANDALEAVFQIHLEKEKQELENEAKLHTENIIKEFPREQIQAIIESNDGDVETAIGMISTAYEKKHLNNNEQERKINALHKRFGDVLMKIRVINALKENNWNVEHTTKKLLPEADRIKKERLCRIFESFSEEDVVQALENEGWNLIKTTETLTRIRTERNNVANINRHKTHIQPTCTKQPGNKRADELSEDVKADLENPSFSPNLMTSIFKLLDQSLRPSGDSAPFVDPNIWNCSIVFTPSEEPEVSLNTQTTTDPSPPPPPPPPCPPAPAPKKAEPIKKEKKTTTTQPQPIQLITLQAEPVIADCHEIVTCRFTNNSTDAGKPSWIGMFPANDDSRPISWQYITEANLNESYHVVPKVYFGQVVFKIFDEKSSVIVTSNPINLGPTFSIRSKVEVKQNGIREAQVTVKQQSGAERTKVWVGLYSSSEQPNNKYETFQYLKDAKDGVLNFELRNDGDYEVRVMKSYLYQKIGFDRHLCAGRLGISISGSDTLTALVKESRVLIRCNLQTVDPAKDKVWVGLYKVNETNYFRGYERYKYLTIPGRSEILFTPPKTGGLYIAHLFAQNSPIPIASSETIPIRDQVAN